MDSLFKPKFFKKLELYQELRRLEKRNGDASTWLLEKDLLQWAHNSHHHLGRNLSKAHVIDRLVEVGRKRDDLIKGQLLEDMLGNLVEHGFAEWADKRDNRYYLDVKITSEGMLMAEMVGDVMAKKWKRGLYSFFFIFILIIIGVSILTAVLVLLKLVLDLLYFQP